MTDPITSRPHHSESLGVIEDGELKPSEEYNLFFDDLEHGLIEGGGSGGKILQVVKVQDGEYATGASFMAITGDNIPPNTEGDEFMSLSITPGNSLNELFVQVTVVFSYDDTALVGTPLVVTLFQDSTVNALAATRSKFVDPGDSLTVTFSHSIVAGTTALTTFKVRAGTATGNLLEFNGLNGGRVLGGVMASSIKIWEIAS